MNKRNGKLNKDEVAAIEKAYEILSEWTENYEERAERRGDDPFYDYRYSVAMNAVTGMCEFLGEL